KPDADMYNTHLNPFFTWHPTLDHIKFLFTQSHYPYWLWNTTWVAVVSTLISVTVSLCAAYAIQRLRFRGSGTLGIAIFLTYLVPPIILFIPLAFIVFHLHLFDSLWALVFTYPTFLIPFCTWLLMGYFKSIPHDLEESARIDGASRLAVVWRIILPLSLPGIFSSTIFAFTLSWNEYLYALTFITSPEKLTVPVGSIIELVTGDVYHWGPLMAAALLGSLPVALVYSFFVEHYVSALSGALKD
ncbi:MAG TPA: carbohydrate ABC transporter permease, partial [bacterium]|nr:carbohydrate ABC transporter permease [bacterium]